MKNFIKRLLLLHGKIHERLALISFYGLLGVYLIIFWQFFSMPPASASRMEEMMVRMLPFYAYMLIPLCLTAVVSWVSALVTAIYRGASRRNISAISISSLFLPLVSYFILSSIYDGFLNGHGTAIHVWLYNL